MRQVRCRRGRAVALLGVALGGCADSGGSVSGEAGGAAARTPLIVSAELARFAYADTLDDGRLGIALDTSGDGDDAPQRAELRAVLSAAPGTILVVPPSNASWLTMRVSPDLPRVPPGTERGAGAADADTGLVLVPPGTFARRLGHDVVERGSNPTGLVVRVVKGPDSVDDAIAQGAGWLLAEPVGLADVLGDLTVLAADVKPRAGGVDVRVDPATPRASFVPLSEVSFELSGKEIYRDDETVLRVKSGKIDGRPEASVDFQVRARKLDTIGFLVRGALDADLELELQTTRATTREVDKTLFERYHVLGPQLVGGVPVFETVRVRVDVTCRVEAGSAFAASAGVHAHEPLAVGARYASGRWTNLSDLGAPEMKPIAPVLRTPESAGLSCGLVPRFQLFIYNVVGPALSSHARASLSVTEALGPRAGRSVDWRLEGELSATLGLDALTRLPGFGALESLGASGLPKADLTLFAKKFSLAGGTVPVAP